MNKTGHCYTIKILATTNFRAFSQPDSDLIRVSLVLPVLYLTNDAQVDINAQRFTSIRIIRKYPHSWT
jgi:hypothetical protein